MFWGRTSGRSNSEILEQMTPESQSKHDKYAPFWATGLIVLCGTGLATIWIDWGDFWKGYVLDITGPSWSYILFRLLYRSEVDNRWTHFFTPVKTFVIFVLICFGIETLQYFDLYSSTFDPWDFPAYIAILFPLFLLDLFQTKKDGCNDLIN